MYQFTEDSDFKARFWFKKEYIENMNWAMLPKRAQAVYPVICCHVNEKGIAFPSERTIAILSGVSDKHVRLGTRDLDGFPGFSCEYYVTVRGKRGKRYPVSLPQENNRNAFPFHRYLLESGMWRELNPAARALYPVMRCYGYFDFEEYADLEDLDYNDEGLFTDRKYDFCEADRSVLVEKSGISYRSFNSAIKDLIDKNLVKRLEYQKWAVCLFPCNEEGKTIYFKRDFLNKKVMTSYRHERK
ncbi:hypothetical protein [Desulfosarcina variabilis]|uniref:hypothetical protein n=1 Tax=Desulfosarcina variabilis TaxID=2300 RepID=UPI003AFA6786